jgi:alpha-N-arabinofuranosidase
LEIALAWLEYTNSSLDTYYANLRRRNGREKPYNVKYWALGNECWGPWQVEQVFKCVLSLAYKAHPALQMTKEDYAKKAYQWAKALKLLDPSITLILCGESGHADWDSYVLKQCLKLDQHALGGSETAALIDMHSIHAYTVSEDPIQNAFAPRSAERSIEICASLIDQARIVNNVPPSVPRQTICFDEVSNPIIKRFQLLLRVLKSQSNNLVVSRMNPSISPVYETSANPFQKGTSGRLKELLETKEQKNSTHSPMP